jgi:hypothetical protein
MRLSAAEYYLQPYPHYFTSIDSEGKGIIYDQLSSFHKGLRKHKGSVFEIDPCNPLDFKAEKAIVSAHPRSKWPFYFEGDCIHHLFLGNTELRDLFLEAPTAHTFISGLKIWIKMLGFYIQRPYNLIFKMLLEKACK